MSTPQEKFGGVEQTLAERKQTASDIHESYRRPNTEFLVIVGGISLVGAATAFVVLILAWLVSDVTALKVALSALAGIVTSLTAGIIHAISKLQHVGSQLGEVKTIMDGRLDELLVLTRKAGRTDGMLAERESVATAAQELEATEATTHVETMTVESLKAQNLDLGKQGKKL